MSNTIRLTIQPKTIDASDNEVNLSQYLAENTFTNMLEWAQAIAYTNGTDKISVPILCVSGGAGTCKMMELLSDQELTLEIYQCTAGTYGTAVATLTGVKNFVSSQSTLGTGAGGGYSFKIIVTALNKTANIIIRQYA